MVFYSLLLIKHKKILDTMENSILKNYKKSSKNVENILSYHDDVEKRYISGKIRLFHTS